MLVPAVYRGWQSGAVMVRRFRALVASTVLCVLVAACAGGPSGDQASPGDIDAHIAEAAKRFDMPELWIREVIRQESGGRPGVVSGAGAIGLMQVMPATYQEMRRKHALGSDPFQPRDNILAGTAYMREMYDLFGAPGFLGAYNCGPGCYGDYLAGKRSLPGETRRYLAAVGPRLNRSTGPDGGDIVVAAVPPRPVTATALPPPAPTRVVVTEVAPKPAPALTPLVAPAPAPRLASAGGPWSVQLGAFRSPDDSGRVIDRARRSMAGTLSGTRPVVQPVDTHTGLLYRARLAGLSQQDAESTCSSLIGQGMACFVVAPGA